MIRHDSDKRAKIAKLRQTIKALEAPETEAARKARKQARRPGWYELRFAPDARKVLALCAQCGRSMWLPPSKVAMYQRCGVECSRAWRAERREERRRECAACQKVFYPRGTQLRMGHGTVCSQACNLKARDALLAPEAKVKAKDGWRASYAAGRIRRLIGEANHQWKGGKQAALARRRDSGKGAASLRAYRAKNPDKVREFAMRRKVAKSESGKSLPRGTIARIGAMQRWLCAICKTSVKRGYHLDHVMPLARGGEHAPRNLQLLCQTCNVRKSAKDPIDYMRSLGRLL
jgi:5-methylcytosine-specific restriction endonuclease McrA